ncbi:MAG: hypothetical protein AAFZ07_17640 [Actinomycetota bacterium]
MPPSTPEDRAGSGVEDDELSDLLVRLVQVLLAFVLGQALIQNQEILIDPQERSNWVALFALATLVVYAAESWIDWHVDVSRHPFRVSGSNMRRRFGLLRLWADLAHVGAVAYLGLTVDHLVGDPNASMTRHLCGYVAAYALFLLALVAKDVTHGRHRDMRTPAIISLAVVTAITVGYALTFAGQTDREVANVVVLLLVNAVNLAHHARFRKLRGLT